MSDTQKYDPKEWDDRLAEFMGWEKRKHPSDDLPWDVFAWAEGDGDWTGINYDEWQPSENLNHAFMVLERICSTMASYTITESKWTVRACTIRLKSGLQIRETSIYAAVCAAVEKLC